MANDGPHRHPHHSSAFLHPYLYSYCRTMKWRNNLSHQFIAVRYQCNELIDERMITYSVSASATWSTGHLWPVRSTPGSARSVHLRCPRNTPSRGTYVYTSSPNIKMCTTRRDEWRDEFVTFVNEGTTGHGRRVQAVLDQRLPASGLDQQGLHGRHVLPQLDQSGHHLRRRSRYNH